MAEWKPEIEVSEELVRGLLARQFPELPVHSLEPLGTGWDNTVFLVNRTWVFRFPHRQVAFPGVQTEMTILPRLAPHLQLPIPTPVFLGQSSQNYPWPFFGARLVPGRESATFQLSAEERTALAPQLARFLRTLHAPELCEALRPHLPPDAMLRTDMATRLPKTRQKLDELRHLGLETFEDALAEMFEAAQRLPPPTATALVHGDLHFRHLLLEERQQLSGIIDWGDLHLGDPATDLQLYWSFLPQAGREVFLSEYGPVSPDSLLRARVVAVFIAAALASYGHQEGMADVTREALWGLRQAADR
ncbi:MAG TPA: phosphotransferase [Hyalangium sp.]|nr:phosphotransferase [Hyalangium sp.]